MGNEKDLGHSHDSAPRNDAHGVSRRSFMKTLGLSAAGASIAGKATARPGGPASAAEGDEIPINGPGPVSVTLKVNGGEMKTSIEPATTLLETLRMNLGLTGAKEICDRGSCGGCSVMVDGKLTASCMMLAIDAIGSEITTVEGLAKGDRLDPVQEAFIKHDALQCGFCTPGFVVACRALLNENPKPTLDEIKHGISGNICRCGTYTNIFNACLEASGQAPILDGPVNG
ncbi:MAG: (2Fe-2S)-binding protein [Phycisphaerales bacterium]|nr:MAG: (2Fe-2S)-binding protein [Phycisphaerales bacterium]